MKPDQLEIDFKGLKKFYDRILIRKYLDMPEKFNNKINSNPTLYKVYIKEFGEFEAGLTVINPGVIKGEYFMTKGHKHKKDWGELYILISGKGKLLIQKRGEKPKATDLKKNKVYNIKGTWGHRLVNTGNKPLEVLTLYSKGAGHDYRFHFKYRKGKIKHDFHEKFFKK